MSGLFNAARFVVSKIKRLLDSWKSKIWNCARC